MSDLSVVEVDARDGVPIVRVSGEIDLSNADEVLTSIESAAVGNAPGLVVDLRELVYLDSAGVRLLFQASRSVASSGGRLVVLVAPDSPARRVLEIADAASVFPLVDSEEAAIQVVHG